MLQQLRRTTGIYYCFEFQTLLTTRALLTLQFISQIYATKTLKKVFNFAPSLRKSIQMCCILLLIPFLWFPELAYTMVQLLCTFPVYHKVLQDCLELLPPVNSREILITLEFADTSIWQMNTSAMQSCFQIFPCTGETSWDLQMKK